MKKSLILIIYLVALSVGIFSYAQGWVSQGREAITVEETVLYGDRSAAEGITVMNRTHCGFHMFWNTSYTVGEALAVKTEYEFHQNQLYEAAERRSDVQVYSNINYAMSGSVDLTDLGANDMLIEAARDVATRTSDGETHEEEVFLKDYYQFYPIVLDLYLQEEEENRYFEKHYISDYLKIPIPEDQKLRVSVTKDTYGRVNYVEQSTTKGDVKINAGSVVVSGVGAYFSLSAFHESGEQIELPKGTLGIHFLPFATKEGVIVPAYEKIHRVYELEDETIQVLRLLKDPKEARLLLFTKESGSVMLSVIDMDTMKLDQKIEVVKAAGKPEVAEEAVNGNEAEKAEETKGEQEGNEAVELELSELKVYDSFLVPIFNGYHFVLIERGPEGLYEVKFAGNLGQYREIAEKLMIYDAVMDFDGSRLAVAVYQPNKNLKLDIDQYQYLPSHSTYLMVFSQNGMAFAGRYDQSSDALLMKEDGSKMVRSIDRNPLSVSFQ